MWKFFLSLCKFSHITQYFVLVFGIKSAFALQKLKKHEHFCCVITKFFDFFFYREIPRFFCDKEVIESFNNFPHLSAREKALQVLRGKSTVYFSFVYVANFYLSLKRGGGPLMSLSPQFWLSPPSGKIGKAPHFRAKSMREMTRAESLRDGALSLSICNIIVNLHWSRHSISRTLTFHTSAPVFN